MQKYVIHGGHPLFGEIEISGAKNAAVAIIPAALLVDGCCRIENIPQISDVTVVMEILQELGADVRTINKNTFEIDCRHIRSCRVPDELARRMRASYYLIGALLGRFGEAQVSMPGGCDLGVRPIDLHLKSFEALGAEVDLQRRVCLCPGAPEAAHRRHHLYGPGLRGRHHQRHAGQPSWPRA